MPNFTKISSTICLGLLTTLLFYTVQSFAIPAIPTDSKTLCIAIGGTRIKAALLPDSCSLKDLQEIQIVDFPRESWLSHKLPSLFENTNTNPLAELLSQSYSKISLSITEPVSKNSLYIGTNKEIPYNIKEACELKALCPVTVENDAVCWTKGYLEFQTLKKQKPQFPCLVLMLERWIGATLILDENTIKGVEINDLECPFSRLRLTSRDQFQNQPLVKWNPDKTLGKTFFNWIFEGKDFSDAQMVPYLHIYNRNFQAFAADICEHMQNCFSLNLSSILVGGINSRFIEASNTFTLPITILSPQKLQLDELSSDAIQLFGCLHICLENSTCQTHD